MSATVASCRRKIGARCAVRAAVAASATARISPMVNIRLIQHFQTLPTPRWELGIGSWELTPAPHWRPCLLHASVAHTTLWRRDPRGLWRVEAAAPRQLLPTRRQAA